MALSYCTSSASTTVYPGPVLLPAGKDPPPPQACPGTIDWEFLKLWTKINPSSLKPQPPAALPFEKNNWNAKATHFPLLGWLAFAQPADIQLLVLGEASASRSTSLPLRSHWRSALGLVPKQAEHIPGVPSLQPQSVGLHLVSLLNISQAHEKSLWITSKKTALLDIWSHLPHLS